MNAPFRTPLQPGFCVLHGNQLEDLTEVLVEWVRDNPLSPLEDEIVLVQSNGMAQWLKLALAADDACGISAAQQFQMPARFLWQAYRDVLGEDAVPATSPFEKSRLVWRIMRLLPDLLQDEAFAPLHRFLRDDADQRKRYQLAERLADLYDQYQVYRAEWLAAWEAGDDRIFRTTADAGEALADNRWQALLWRALVGAMPAADRERSRARIHRRFLQTLEAGEVPAGALPARVVVFGLSSLPRQMLEALSALAPHCQILMMVQNPCRHYWADIIEDRELLRRQQWRHGHKLADVPEEEQHRHANPLLAAWGKQGRDYIGMLYDFDVPEAYQQWFREIDLFTPPGERQRAPDALLPAIQHAILELEPPQPEPEPRAPDASVVFHVSHGPQREVEILHDQLLAAFEASAVEGAPLRPRDVLVMVPDIEAYTPHIEAVFGNFDDGDPRAIPYTISDRSQRHSEPLAAALEQLLDLPNLRFTPGELLGLLETPALRERFGIAEADLPELRTWIEGAGIRWGLHAGQRAALELPAGFEQNSWYFGLRRMLLGYAAGDGGAWCDIEPYDEVGGLQGALAGRLIELIDTLERHWRILRTPAPPRAWVERLRTLGEDFFAPATEEDFGLYTRLIQALDAWQEACDAAGFDEALPLAVAREVWLGALDDSGLSQRFLAGRVNFCTLMPMRSIPFRRVCLLGMNDGDYPRTQAPHDFDLMARPGQYRPGDRSRRDDDRYLFLEALLAAREQLYISWVGRDIRDNDSRPPSVLVAQLRDYLDAAWQTPEGASLAEALTRVHPLQPFSPAYFLPEQEAGAGLFTYAREWRQAHHRDAGDGAAELPLPMPPAEAERVMAPGEVARFLRDPVGHFFRDRLKVRLDEPEGAEADSEPFALGGLEDHRIGTELVTALSESAPEDEPAALERSVAALRRSGALPPGELGDRWLEPVAQAAGQAVAAWRAARAGFPEAQPLVEAGWSGVVRGQAVRLEDWLDAVHADGQGARLRLRVTPGTIQGRPDKSLALWLDHLLACAGGQSLESRLIGSDRWHRLAPLPPEEARERLEVLLDAWMEGLCRPLPLALRAGMAYVQDRDRGKDADQALGRARRAYESAYRRTGEVDYAGNAALRRVYPDFDHLQAPPPGDEPGFADWAERVYGPLVAHLIEEEHP
ncbi:exodeoxyribonuclease V subunit gamma [Aquisalimonas lutea]|uniref:exodeoxyribonuclease V subunit gamma n=1 Tax=Aquisalimonas lutea TaxID=1327750 RepID=UPI0025B3C8AB|nr:exodeoxyribonuclease V subunit gamma [Aquisalimonas lutea]MDN3518084.1 exodeoxyribonuclease V subunit gamma [Aquisalimonas lutea]